MLEIMGAEPSEENYKLMRAIDNCMEELEKREKVYWHQRSRQSWIEVGDKNTRFFHEKKPNNGDIETRS